MTITALIVLVTLPLTVSAHTLKETNARITLRDGQVEVRLWVDMHRWQKNLQDNQAWLLGDINQVMPATLTAKEINTYIKKVLSKETLITLNNQKVPLVVVSILPDKKTAKQHEYSELILSSKHSIAQVKTLNMRFPKSLGAVHTSVVKPKYKMVAAGAKAKILF